tara:strand:+ start:4132 stop:4476 length:345 start_codon:yes stop_codon:yes gene_type:complete
MAIIYNWNCQTVEVHPTQDGKTNVVYNVSWILTGVSDELDSEGNAYESTMVGVQPVPLYTKSEFISFEDLTNEIVVEWTKEAMGANKVFYLETTIEENISLKINPTSVVMTIAD